MSASAAALAVFIFGSEAIFLLIALLPAAYLTLFLFVLPSLWLLRRLRQEALWSFSAVCGVSSVAPWFILYAVFFSEGPAKYGGAHVQVLALLLVPAVLAAASGAAIHWRFGQQQGQNGA